MFPKSFLRSGNVPKPLGKGVMSPNRSRGVAMFSKLFLRSGTALKAPDYYYYCDLTAGGCVQYVTV